MGQLIEKSKTGKAMFLTVSTVTSVRLTRTGQEGAAGVDGFVFCACFHGIFTWRKFINQYMYDQVHFNMHTSICLGKYGIFKNQSINHCQTNILSFLTALAYISIYNKPQWGLENFL